MIKKEDIIKKLPFVLLILLILAALGYLGFRYVAPFGKKVSYSFTSKLPGTQEVTNFSPGKNSVLKIPSQVIKTDQSKFSLQLLSPQINSIKAVLKFKKGPTEIKLGVRGNEKEKFVYKPLYQSLLQDLSWKKTEDNGLTLWQKEKVYNSISDFISSRPQGKETTFYFVDDQHLPTSQVVPAKQIVSSTINTTLRGSYNFLIRVDYTPLTVKVAKQDLNLYAGEDKVKIVLRKENNFITEKVIPDDGVADTSRLKLQTQEETITLDSVEAGVYQLNLIYEGKGDDVIFSKIEVNQPKIVAQDKIFILGNKPTNIWTNIEKLQITGPHKESIQTLKLNNKENLEIKSEGKPYTFDLAVLSDNAETGSIYVVTSPKNDLMIEGNGYFAFSENAFFNPEEIQSFNFTTSKDLEKVDYILTSYRPAKTEGDWFVAEAVFDPEEIKIDGDKLYFSLEAPGLSEYSKEMEINSLEITVESDGLLKKNSEEKSVSTEVSEDEKKSILQKTGQKVSQFFGNIYNKTKTFLVSSYNKVFKKKRLEQKLPTPTLKPKLTPTRSPSPPLTLSPSPKAEKFDMLVKVLNGGAETGIAKQFTDKLKENGFINATFGNADNSSYRDSTIKYREINKSEKEKISRLLLDFGYKNVTANQVATSSSEIIVILGKK